jgi:hypothetical protein
MNTPIKAGDTSYVPRLRNAVIVHTPRDLRKKSKKSIDIHLKQVLKTPP